MAFTMSNSLHNARAQPCHKLSLKARPAASVAAHRSSRTRHQVKVMAQASFSPQYDSANIKVIGVGGGGSNAVNRMRATSQRAQSARSVHAGSTLGARGSVNATGRRRVHLRAHVARRLAFLCTRLSLRVTHPAVARPVNATGLRCVRLRVRVRALPRGLHSPRLRCFGRSASQRAQSARSARARSVLGAWCSVQGARRVLGSHVLRAASQRTRFARSVRAGSGLGARGLANATGRRRVRLRAHVRTLPRELFSPRLRCSGRRASQRARFVRSARACSMSRARRSVLGAWCGLGPRVLRAASPRAQSARSVHAGSALGARGSVNARCGDKSTGCHAQVVAGGGSPPARPKEGREEPNPANA
ncbi:hypothetical protein PPROV_000540600 [Pycnococcus provasolii]|uniref:Tubulin/FtsZ GTPase domain-containing protein n=1 Tax=Pycnococcus provasolii TaxID=41880 RepID=A0A830HM52_9CHLO|nr:hypothetical protein PPROV_000540600 [Pycnococcus provasolii]